VVDNLPLSLLDHLLSTPISKGGAKGRRPLAIGMDTRTRDFDASRVVKQIKDLASDHSFPVETLYFDCAGAELIRRYSETRRRHPLAPDRPATDGIAAERELMEPLRRWADSVIDTTDTDSNALQRQIRERFGSGSGTATLHVMSFGFARGLPRNADNVFDMRFLRNPHWIEELRPLTGLDAPVGAYVAGTRLIRPPCLRSRRCCSRSSRAMRRKENPMLPSLLVVRAGAIVPFMWRSVSPRGCGRRDFRPPSNIAISVPCRATSSKPPSRLKRWIAKVFE
jgi:hypothetical protein